MIGEYKILIDGKWVSGKDVRDIKSPYDMDVVGKVHFADVEQVKGAVGSAQEAFQKTKMLSSYERARSLEFVSDQIAKTKEELARSITLGPVRQ